jgi:regulator of replication initiation timing
VEQLENELKLYKEGRHISLNNTHDGIESNNFISEENRRLKAENNVLQKKLAGKSKHSRII